MSIFNERELKLTATINLYSAGRSPDPVDEKTIQFSTCREYSTKLVGIAKEVKFISGTRLEVLFNTLYEINRGNVKQWFMMLHDYKMCTRSERAAVRWLMVILPNGCSMERALELAPKVGTYAGLEIDYVKHFINDTFHVQTKLGCLDKYFDYEAYCFDLVHDKVISKVTYEGDCFTITNANEFNVWGI